MDKVICPICGNTEGLEEEYDVYHKCGWEIDKEAYAKGEPVR